MPLAALRTVLGPRPIRRLAKPYIVRPLVWGGLFLTLLPWRGALELPVALPGVTAARGRLVAAFGPLRLAKARLTGGLGYLPLEERTMIEGGQVFGSLELPDLRLNSQQQGLVSLLGASTGREPTPKELGDTAFRVLFSNDWVRRRKAGELLEEATAEAPRDAALLSDLAAVYLEGGFATVTPWQFVALSVATRAVASDPRLPEARFNLALALERCGLLEMAKSAWVDYLHRDPASGWADEARQHLHALRRPSPLVRWVRNWRARALAGETTIPYEIMEAAHEDLLSTLLERWAPAVEQGSPSAARAILEDAVTIARILDEKQRDRAARHLIEAVEARQSPSERRRLAAGFLAYAQGEKLFQQDSLPQARVRLEQASRLLRKPSTPLWPWAEVRLAEIDCEDARFKSAWRRLRRIRTTFNLFWDPRLHAQQLWVEGLYHLYQGQLSAAEAALQLAMAAAGWDERSIQAEVYIDRLTETRVEANWGGRTWALLNVQRASLRQRFLLAISGAASLARVDSQIARLAAEEAWLLAQRSGSRHWLAEAGPWLSEGHGRLSPIDKDFDPLSDPSSIPADSGERESFPSRLSLARLLAHPPDDARRRVQDLSQAISYFGLHDRSQLAVLYRLRAEAREQAGDPRGQATDLRSALRLTERSEAEFQGQTVEVTEAWETGFRRSSGVTLRNRLIETILDQFVELQLSRGSVEGSLTLEEGSRRLATQASSNRRRLHSAGSWPSPASHPFSSDELLHGLPPFVSVVEYRADRDRLWAWVFHGGRVTRVELPVSVAKLRHPPPVDSRPDHMFLIPHIEDTELSRWLVQPIAKYLGDGGELVFLLETLFESVDFRRLSYGTPSRTLGHDFDLVTSFKPPGFSTEGNYAKASAEALKMLKPKSVPSQGDEPALFEPTLNTSQILRSLPKGATLLEYSFLGERLVGWVAHRGVVHTFVSPASRREIDEVLKRLRLSADHRRPRRFEARLTDLSAMLLAPAASYLPKSGDLLIVPDEELGGIPFGALRRRPGGPRLVETHTLTLVPSATAALRRRAEGIEQVAPIRKVLVVENPQLKTPHGTVGRLIGVERESRLLRHLFPGAQVLSGGAAVESSPLVQQAYDLVHFGGHSRTTPQEGDRSLQPDPAGRFRSCRLLVLAACETAYARFGPIEAPIWRPDGELPGTGPAVLSSLWKVSDAETSQLLEVFYRELHNSAGASVALRRAQLRFLHSKSARLRNPLAWAGLQLFGTRAG